MQVTDNKNVSLTGGESNSPAVAQDSVPANTDFEALELAFLGSLLPGIVHNLATPLSGVIGATQLLEMRIGEQERILAELERSAPAHMEALIQQHKKSCNNLDIMSRNARHLTELLQIIIRRFHRSSQDTPAPQSLFELVSNELQFLDANLTYKHKVRKRFDMSTEPLTVFAVYRHVIAVVDEFVLRALAAHDFTRGLVDFSVITNFEPNWGNIELEAQFFETEEEPLETAALELYLARVAEHGAKYQMDRKRGQLKVLLQLPRKLPSA